MILYYAWLDDTCKQALKAVYNSGDRHVTSRHGNVQWAIQEEGLIDCQRKTFKTWPICTECLFLCPPRSWPVRSAEFPLVLSAYLASRIEPATGIDSSDVLPRSKPCRWRCSGWNFRPSSVRMVGFPARSTCLCRCRFHLWRSSTDLRSLTRKPDPSQEL